jgi:hypothetical protein
MLAYTQAQAIRSSLMRRPRAIPVKRVRHTSVGELDEWAKTVNQL